MNNNFPSLFVETTREMLGSGTEALLDSLRTEPPVSVRWNPYKTKTPPGGNPVPWNRYGRYLSERPSFTLDPLFHAGAYYPQEASSMFVEHIARCVPEEDRRRILDLCAAPGGKATLYSTLAGAEGIVVANEPVRTRALTLADNVRKWGVGNTIVTNNEPSQFAGLREWFDIVAVDAPCSGEGMFRKNPAAKAEWSAGNVEMCAARQKRILSDAWEALRPEGLLIYSTCTFNREENEANILWLRDNFDCEDAGIIVPREWNIEVSCCAGVHCFRFWPHLIAGEGFFAAAIRKGGQKGKPVRPKARKPLMAEVPRKEAGELARWVGQPELMRFARIGDALFGYYNAPYAEIKLAAEFLNTIHSGICMGQIFGGKLKPDHSLAMFHDVNRESIPSISLPLPETLSYLRREDLRTENIVDEGINLITFDGYALGWVKKVSSRINNLYPKSQMVLHK